MYYTFLHLSKIRFAFIWQRFPALLRTAFVSVAFGFMLYRLHWKHISESSVVHSLVMNKNSDLEVLGSQDLCWNFRLSLRPSTKIVPGFILQCFRSRPQERLPVLRFDFQTPFSERTKLPLPLLRVTLIFS